MLEEADAGGKGFQLEFVTMACMHRSMVAAAIVA